MNQKLIVVGTPIGNLKDISQRAITALTEADIIFCEDTRVTRKLLSALDIHDKKLVSARNELKIQLNGKNMVLVSDAGLPGVSDPGRMIVDAAYSQDIAVEVIPGPTALTAALAISGLPGDRFVFEGFLPPKGSKRNKRLKALAVEDRTVILYESPHRVIRTVKEIAELSSNERQIVITRELTKLHEEVWRGSIADAITHLESKPPRGEYTLVLE